MTTVGAGWSGSGRFDSLDAGGVALAEVLQADGSAWAGEGVDVADAVVLAVVPNGVPAAVRVAGALRAALVGVEVVRSDDGVEVPSVPGLSGRVVVVVDDAVETGTAAAAVGAAAREAGAARVVLAVPVCPRESEAGLGRRFDAIVAAVRPLARRALEWHYPGFTPMPLPEARAAVAEYQRAWAAGR